MQFYANYAVVKLASNCNINSRKKFDFDYSVRRTVVANVLQSEYSKLKLVFTEATQAKTGGLHGQL